ncbi:hypothetical protein GGR51DRAFT_566633 [Nemania sp. FL0031]|nr:hypothetical protein GGR51DRAFT_566633 [Nemania sp. FL0031]
MATGNLITSSFFWDIWQCGHITGADDGAKVSEDAKLSHLPRYDHMRSNVHPRLGDMCPQCYTDDLLRRLRGMRALLQACSAQHETARIAHDRLVALLKFYSIPTGVAFDSDNDFANYPADFKQVVSHTLNLESSIYYEALKDFDVAYGRLRSRLSRSLLRPLMALRDHAMLWGAYGNSAVKECVQKIMDMTTPMLDEVHIAEITEYQLLRDLNIQGGELGAMILDLRRRRERHAEALQHPTFDDGAFCDFDPQPNQDARSVFED